jgi:hypothetical protein
MVLGSSVTVTSPTRRIVIWASVIDVCPSGVTPAISTMTIRADQNTCTVNSAPVQTINYLPTKSSPANVIGIGVHAPGAAGNWNYCVGMKDWATGCTWGARIMSIQQVDSASRQSNSTY